MNEVLWERSSAEEFWKLADDLQQQTVEHAKELFAYVEHAEPRALADILIQYRYFTIYHIPDLAILISRMRDGRLRSFFADVLTDELGNADFARDPLLDIEQFHLAIPVRDLQEARHFYANVIGAKEGRSTAAFIDFNFYGHHLVLHAAPRDGAGVFTTFRSQFHGEQVQIPHFGMNLDHAAWARLAERIKAANYAFFDPPHVRMQGMPGEHATLFVVDPSGNALEFKSFRNHREVFAKVFDPHTEDLDCLHQLAAEAASLHGVN